MSNESPIEAQTLEAGRAIGKVFDESSALDEIPSDIAALAFLEMAVGMWVQSGHGDQFVRHMETFIAKHQAATS